MLDSLGVPKEETDSSTTGMASGSASDYISDLLAAMDGETYARTLNEYATRYFLNQIQLDYGEAAFQRR